MNNPNQGQDNPLSVQTISITDGKATAPKRRMSTPAAAWTAYTNLWYQGRKRDARFGDIAGIYAGYPPTPPNVLANNGVPDCPNINTKQFQAKIDKYVSTWNAVSSQSDGWFKVEADHPDPMERMRRSDCLTQYFNDAVRQWQDPDDSGNFGAMSGYLIHSAARDKQMGLFGVGIGLWEDEIDFRWVMIPTRRVFFPQGTRLTMENCPAVFVEDNNMSVAQLWNMRGKAGWNDAAIERAIFDRVELQAQTQQRNWSYSEWINYVRNNDVPYIYDFAPVRVIHAFTQEFDMTISHSIFCDFTYTANSSNKDMARSKKSKTYNDAAQSFLFDKSKVATRWQQCISIFADNAGPEGDIHGVKGFGDLNYDGCHLNNLVFNRAALGAFISNTLMFEGQSESDIQKLDQIVMTNMGIMPVGLTVSPVKFPGDINGAMEIFNAGTAILDQNSRDFPQNQQTAGGDQPTATQVNYDRADEAQFDGLQVETYRVFGDAMASEMYRRIAQPASKYPEAWAGGKVAKMFRDKCEEDGIPEKDLLKVKSVKMNRNGGTGNMGLDMMRADVALAMATPGLGQQNARKFKLATAMGYSNVGAFIQDAPQATPDDETINIENCLLQEGQVPEAFGWQDQAKHIQAHLALMSEASQTAQQIIELQAVAKNIEGAQKLANTIMAGAEHVDKHIALMQQVMQVDKKKPTTYEPVIKEATRQSNNLKQIGTALSQDVEKEKGIQQPQISAEMAKAQNQIQIENAKAAADIKRKDDAAKAKLGHMAVQNEAKTQMKLQDHALTVDAKQAQTTEELKLNAAKGIQTLVHTAAEHHQNIRHTEEQNAADAAAQTEND